MLKNTNPDYMLDLQKLSRFTVHAQQIYIMQVSGNAFATEGFVSTHHCARQITELYYLATSGMFC